MRYLFAGMIAVLALTWDAPSEYSDYSLAATVPVVPVGTIEPIGPDYPDQVSLFSSNERISGHNSSDAELLADTHEPPSLDRLCEAVKVAAEESGIPIGFFARLLWQESRFRADEVSSKGAQGIAQFMPQTAAQMGLTDPFDPLEAIPASARFLRKLQNQFGNLGLAAAAYNAGGGRIEKWLSRRAPLPGETRAYVRIITGNKAEDWTAESKIISVPSNLPQRAPCDGIGGLSKSGQYTVAEVPVTVSSFVGEILRKAAADDTRAKQSAARTAAKGQFARANASTPLTLARSKSKSTKTTHVAGRIKHSQNQPPVRLASASNR